MWGAANPDYGDIVTTGALDVVNNPQCEIVDALPTT